MMSELEYRPQRNSAVMEDVAGPDAVVMGQVDVQGLPLESQPAAPVPASDERPVPKPRNRQFLQPVAPAQPPHVIQPVPLPAAQPPHFIQPDPLAAAQPPPYQYQQQAPLPPYQPGAGAQQHQQFVASQQALAANPAAADGTAEKTLPFAVFQMRVKGSKKFCTIWRGVLEITARAAIIVLGVLCLALSPVIIDTVDSNSYFSILLAIDASLLASDPLMIEDTQNLIMGSKDIAGFMIFLSIMCFIVEIPSIVGRFILRGGTKMLLVLHVVDAIASGILAVFFLCGGAVAAAYSGQWSEPPQLCEEVFINLLKENLANAGTSIAGISLSCGEETLAGQLAGLAVFGFIGLAIAIFLTIWTIYALVAKWDHVSNGCKEDAEANTNAH